MTKPCSIWIVFDAQIPIIAPIIGWTEEKLLERFMYHNERDEICVINLDLTEEQIRELKEKSPRAPRDVWDKMFRENPR